MNKLPLTAMLIAAAPVPVAAAPTQTAAPSVELALAICRATYFGDASRAKEVFDALPTAEDRGIVSILCIAYRQGALDAIEAARKSRGNVA